MQLLEANVAELQTFCVVQRPKKKSARPEKHVEAVRHSKGISFIQSITAVQQSSAFLCRCLKSLLVCYVDCEGATIQGWDFGNARAVSKKLL